MKSKLTLSISALLFLLFSAEAQMPGISQSDSLDLLSYQLLKNFILSDTVSKKWEYSVTRNEEHRLVIPIQGSPGSDLIDLRMSYDKSIPSVYNKEATVGSPFLLPAYTTGLVIVRSYKAIYIQDYFYNYDKMSGNLLLKRDKDNPIAVDKDRVNSFCLKDGKEGYIFMRVPLINSSEFLQVIHKGSKYSAYALYKVNFIESNQATNGYMTAGKEYDEYKDVKTYYLIDEIKQEWSVFELTKKSIKKALGESERVNQFFKYHKYDDITESLVAGLLETVNK